MVAIGIVRDETGELDTSYYMAYVAEIDLSLPYSFICDVWDILSESPETVEAHQTILKQVIWTYLNNPGEYRMNPKAACDF